MTITLTKDLPTEEGRYFWGAEKIEPMIVNVGYTKYSYDTGYEDQESEFLASLDHNEMGHFSVEYLGGYWAKIEKEQFKFEV